MNDQGKTKGRPRDHLAPLDPVERSATVATLRFLRREKKMKAPAICDELSTFSEKFYKLVASGDALGAIEGVDEPNFLPDETTIRRAINIGAASDAILLGLNLWLKDGYSHLYKRHRHEEMVRANEVFVRASRAVLGGDDKLELSRINQLQGRYRLIRPYHLEPRRKAIAELFTIGTNASPYECCVISKFENEHGRADGTEASGRIVPHAQRAMVLLGNSLAGRSHLILHFDHIAIDGHSKMAVAMRGIVIASIGSHPSSAYPLQCIRLEPDDAFEPHVLSAEEVGRLPQSAKQALDRGSVYWNAEDYTPWGQKR